MFFPKEHGGSYQYLVSDHLQHFGFINTTVGVSNVINQQLLQCSSGFRNLATMDNNAADQAKQEQVVQLIILFQQLLNMGNFNYHDEDAQFRCRDYLRGIRCQNGDDCPRLHRLPRNDGIQCLYHQFGTCTRAAIDCHFQHGNLIIPYIENNYLWVRYLQPML